MPVERPAFFGIKYISIYYGYNENDGIRISGDILSPLILKVLFVSGYP